MSHVTLARATHTVRRPRTPYRVRRDPDRTGMLVYTPIVISREALDRLQVINYQMPPRSSGPWIADRGATTLIGFWVKGEMSPQWYQAEVVE